MIVMDEFSRFWVTQKGDIYYPRQMTDKHLLNTIPFIERRVGLVGDVDTQELLFHNHKIYRRLVLEAVKRGIMKAPAFIDAEVPSEQTPYATVRDAIQSGVVKSKDELCTLILDEFRLRHHKYTYAYVLLFERMYKKHATEGYLAVLNAFFDAMFEEHPNAIGARL